MAKNQKYQKLFEPIKIGNVNLKNRIVKSAQWFIYPEHDGSVGERVKGWYESLAVGGAGLITTEQCVVDFPLGASDIPHIRLDDDKFIPGLTELADVVHKHNCPVFVQMTHAGPAHNPQISGLKPVAASSFDPPAEPRFAVSRELQVSEIKNLVEKFAEAALRVKKAGFDGVEIHMAHYALINSFLSRVQNKRSDAYGSQNIENRSRFSVEIIRRVRELVGPDFVVGVRMNAKEWGNILGTTNGEAIEFARLFEKEGVNYLQVSAWGYGQFAFCANPSLLLYPEPANEDIKEFTERIKTGALIPEAAELKKAISIPISGVGDLDYEIGEKILNEGKVDLVCFGRRFMADPEFPNKLSNGREEDIRPCLNCYNCIQFLFTNKPIQCRVNAFAGNEKVVIRPAEQKKRIVVVGAGPGGMEAARVAATRGHEVAIFDKAREIGGLLNTASFIKGREVDDLTRLIKYYRIQLKKLGVKIHLDREMNPGSVFKENPDVLILATGGGFVYPQIPENNGKGVITSEQLRNQLKPFIRVFGSNLMRFLTKLFMPLGKRVVIVGSDLAGIQTAVFLTKRGRKVTIIDEEEQAGTGMIIPWLEKFLTWAKSKKIDIYNGVTYEDIKYNSNKIDIDIMTENGEYKTIGADSIIIMPRYVKDIASDLAKINKIPVYVIDSTIDDEYKYIFGSIHNGARIGLTV